MSFKTAFFAFLKGEKSQAELEAYRRASAQTDELEAAVQEQVHDLPLDPGAPPWARAEHQRQAVALAWIARGLTTVANALLEADEHGDPSTAGYLPVVTFQQAKALYEQIPDTLRQGWEALANPRFRMNEALPLPLGPRVEADGKCPLLHLQGILAATEALDSYAETRFNAHLAAIKGAGETPAAVQSVVDSLAQLRARARSKLGFGREQLAALRETGSVPLATHEDAETRLWNALSDQFLLGQWLAMPELADGLGSDVEGREIAKEDRWFLADAEAKRELAGTTFGEQEMREFWSRKGWRTTPREERYFAECKRLLDQRALRSASHWATCPFDPVYRALKPVRVLDVSVHAGQELHLDMDEHKDVLALGKPTFRRTAEYEEEHEEGHETDPSGG